MAANDQMARALTEIAPRAHDPKLKQALQLSIEGIKKYAGTIKSLFKKAG
jgi:ferritin-like metal-binding protein YciE